MVTAHTRNNLMHKITSHIKPVTYYNKEVIYQRVHFTICKKSTK